MKLIVCRQEFFSKLFTTLRELFYFLEKQTLGLFSFTNRKEPFAMSKEPFNKFLESYKDYNSCEQRKKRVGEDERDHDSVTPSNQEHHPIYVVGGE